MINKLLIANRGEIAVRVIRTAQRMGIQTVAVYSAADQFAQHVKLADEAVFIGPAPSNESYLVIDKIIAAAQQTGADAIHPGYGFLSENEAFAERCAAENLIFIGPPTSAIAAMGSKSAAKAIMSEAQVPLVPGYHGEQQAADFLLAEAEKIGFPVLLKAAYGGGGKGMRIVANKAEFQEALEGAQREARAAFGNDKILVEKYIGNPRHVEIQVFCDQHGNAVYLAERDCSVQRRHQKVIEEAPAPGIADATRKAMGEAAIRAAQAIDYVGAGTVEFLLDEDGSFYFMEMNTRLQVEHPVTEMVTGQDLVEWQILVASGAPLPLQQEQIQVSGHAFEARIYAEDPAHEFLPSTGVLNHLRTPAESAYLRIDSGVVEGDEVSAYYDPMIAKLIVWGETREIALGRLIAGLNQYRIGGVKTNIDFLRAIARQPQFQAVELSTRFIEYHQQQLFAASAELDLDYYATLATLAEASYEQQHSDRNQVWSQLQGFRLNQAAVYQLDLLHNEQLVQVELERSGDGWVNRRQPQQHYQVTRQDDGLQVRCNGQQQTVYVFHSGYDVTVFTEQASVTFTRHLVADTLTPSAAAGSLAAPMNGTIVQVLVKPGDSVEAEQALVIMEAMKMEYTIRAPVAGTVTEVYYQAGDLVADGAELLSLEEDAE